jgi:hypothetical protein
MAASNRSGGRTGRSESSSEVIAVMARSYSAALINLNIHT